jgi:hypothetical protein
VTAPQPAPAPGALADVLAPDLVAIIGHLAAGSEPIQPASPASVPATALTRARATLACYHDAALAWSPGHSAAPPWASWAGRLAVALGELLSALDPADDPPAPAGPGSARPGPQ